MARRRWTWWLLSLLLAGCNGTPLGDQLSSSFSPGSGGTAPTPTAAGLGSAAPANGSQGPAGTSPAPGTVPPGSAAPTPLPSGSPAAPRTTAAPPPRPVTARPATPAPYRVTIKLPAADPSAPAEAVTRALRSAGLTFEVESIERVPSSGGNPTGTTPAPATR